MDIAFKNILKYIYGIKDAYKFNRVKCKVILKNEWLANIQNKNVQKDYEHDLEEFSSYFNLCEDSDYLNLKRIHIVSWRNYLIGQGLKADVVRRKIWALGLFFFEISKKVQNFMDPLNIDYESVLRRFYSSILKPGDIAVDVGAHVGDHTIPIARAVAPHGKVYAIEPIQGCLNHLNHLIRTENQNLTENVELLNIALANYEGISEFIVATDTPWLSGLRKRIYDQPTRLEKIMVQVNTFDNLFSEFPRLDYIKIDAEGGEYHIVKGAMRSLSKYRPVVSFEFGDIAIGEYKITSREMAELWTGMDYDIYDIDGQKLTIDDFVKSADVQLVWDYICIPKENLQLHKSICNLSL